MVSLINAVVSNHLMPYFEGFLDELKTKSVSYETYAENSNCPPNCSWCCGVQGKAINYFDTGLAQELLNNGLSDLLIECINENRETIINDLMKKPYNIDLHLEIATYHDLFIQDPKMINHVNNLSEPMKKLYDEAVSLGNNDSSIKFDFALETGSPLILPNLITESFYKINKKIKRNLSSRIDTIDELSNLKNSLSKIITEEGIIELYDFMDELSESIDEQLRDNYSGIDYEKASEILSQSFKRFFNQARNNYNQLINHETPLLSIDEANTQVDYLLKHEYLHKHIVLDTINRLIIKQNNLKGNHETGYIIKSPSFTFCPFFYGNCVIHEFENYPKNCKDYTCQGRTELYCKKIPLSQKLELDKEFNEEYLPKLPESAKPWAERLTKSF